MSDGGQWVSIRKACKFYGKSAGTLRDWGDNGVVECKRTPKGHRVFFIRPDDVYGGKVPNPKSYIYVRVSSKKQDEVSEGNVSQVVVFSKDRLCRFGFELVEHIFLKNNTNLVVHEQVDKSPEEEFTEDILSILQVFACRWNGERKYKLHNGNNEIQVEVNQHPEEKPK